jgi:hypothetical protein
VTGAFPGPAGRHAHGARDAHDARDARDGQDVDALVTDGYLQALLAAHARGADRGPAMNTPVDPIRTTADRLARDLPRFHPSFLFEEALAGRLAETAARMRLPVAAGGEGLVVPLPGVMPAADWDDDLDDLRTGRGRRPLIIRGALTSAAISLAGAAYVAWRMNRPQASPMARAARAVARSRPA